MNQLEKIKCITHIYNTIDERFTHAETMQFLDDLGEGAAPPGYAYGSQPHFFLSLKYLKTHELVRMANRLRIKPYPKEWDNSSFSAKAFISYESKNKNFALDIQEALEDFNVESFVAVRSIKTSEIFDNTIIDGLRNMDFFISIHTTDFSKSLWCQQEVGFALGKDVKIIPIMAEEKPQGFIERHQAINGKQKLGFIATDIRLALKNDPRTKKLYNTKMLPYIYEEEEDDYLESESNVMAPDFIKESNKNAVAQNKRTIEDISMEYITKQSSYEKRTRGESDD